MLELGKSKKLTPELAVFIRSMPEDEIIEEVKKLKPNKAVLIAMGVPVFKKPSEKVASAKEINRYLEMHCTSMGMEYNGYEEVDKLTGMAAKLDKEWELELSKVQISEMWYRLGLPMRTALLCGASEKDNRYAPFLSLMERNIWVYGPDRETFVWYVYNALGETLNFSS